MRWDKLYEDVRRRDDIGGNAKVIFSWLVPLVARGVNPGARVIAKECGVNAKTAARALKQLREAGLLGWTDGPSGAGRRYLIAERTAPDTPGTVRPQNGGAPESGTPPTPQHVQPPPPKWDRSKNGTAPEKGSVTAPEKGTVPPPKRGHNQTTRPQDQKHTPQTPRRGAVRVSSLSGLPDPLGELDGVSSEEFVTRAFDAVGREIGMAPPPRRPQDRARAQELERWALELAPRVAESRGMEVEAAFCKLLEVAFDLHKKAYCEAEEARRAGKPARVIEWRLGWVASRWERYTRRAVAS